MFVFLVCAIQPIALNGSFFTSSHKYSLGHGLDPLVGPTLFLLCAPYRTEFKMDLLKIHTTYSLDKNLDFKEFLSLITYICGHKGTFCVL